MLSQQNTSSTEPVAANAGADEDFLTDAAFSVSGEIDAAYATIPLAPPGSGDFHAAFPLPDGGVGFVLGDVAGHGTEAGVHAQNLCRAVVDLLLEGLPPDEALGFVNAATEMSTEFDGFATVVAGVVAPETGEIVYASGGHEPPLIAPAFPSGMPPKERETLLTALDSTGPPLGVLGGDEATYHTNRASLPPNGTLLLYTDGITEARRGKNFMGLPYLESLFVRFAPLPPLRVVRKIVGAARAFSGRGRKLRDDAALLALRRKTPPQTPSDKVG